ncbi:MAG TPA: chorismate synthase [Methanothrix sp.]|nr:chorismate synthase [Methanothrix sp.]
MQPARPSGRWPASARELTGRVAAGVVAEMLLLAVVMVVVAHASELRGVNYHGRK